MAVSVVSLGTMSYTTNTGMDVRENLSLIEFFRVIDFPEPDTLQEVQLLALVISTWAVLFYVVSCTWK